MRYNQTIEAMESSRPLEQAGWLEGLKQEVVEVFGAEAVNLEDEILRENGIIIFDAQDIACLDNGTSGVLEHLSADELVVAAQDEMPESFNNPVKPKLTGELVVRGAWRPDGTAEHVLMAPIKPEGPLPKERGAAMSATSKVASRSMPRPRHLPDDGSVGITLRLPWQGSTPQNRLWLRLAVVDGYYMSSDPKMMKVARHLPPDVMAGAGRIEPVTDYMIGRSALAFSK